MLLTSWTDFYAASWGFCATRNQIGPEEGAACAALLGLCRLIGHSPFAVPVACLQEVDVGVLCLCARNYERGLLKPRPNGGTRPRDTAQRCA